MEPKPQKSVRVTINYESAPVRPTTDIPVWVMVGVGMCVAVYIGSVWAGNRLSTGEDGGWFLYVGIVAFAGVFAIPIVAMCVGRSRGE